VIYKVSSTTIKINAYDNPNDIPRLVPRLIPKALAKAAPSPLADPLSASKFNLVQMFSRSENFLWLKVNSGFLTKFKTTFCTFLKICGQFNGN
jgi:hypothetical protein